MSIEYELFLPKNYQLRGFELTLAELEIEKLIGPIAERNERSIVVKPESEVDDFTLQRLTFIESIEIRNNSEKRALEPYQTTIDRTAYISDELLKNKNIDAICNVKIKRRTHGYLTHSLHTYKGKFYPQLVKSILNYMGVREGDVVLDPFCGSGTTLVECLLNGYYGLGVDLNPLAVLISRSKVGSLLIDPNELSCGINDLLENVQVRFRELDIGDLGLDDPIIFDRTPKLEPVTSRSYPNREYLLAWFDELTLTKLIIICNEISRLPNPRIRDFSQVILSRIVRHYSFQAPGQLRIRRRKDLPDSSDLLLRYRSLLLKHAKSSYLSSFLRLNKNQKIPEVFLADVRKINEIENAYFNKDEKVDAIVTSPPYATALPYIDTDRLSLMLLNLISKETRRDLEWKMIGNREITNGKRRDIESEILDNRSSNHLPSSVMDFIIEIFERNQQSEVGFRRKNKASLLYRYYLGMHESIGQFYRLLKPGSYCSIIIGNNKTTAGDKTMEIPTDKFLTDISEQVGFSVDRVIPMTDQPAYMAHSNNVIETERILIFKK